MMENNTEKPFRIMVIGGTLDSHQIIDELLNKKIEVIATVATTYGESLLQEKPGLRVFHGRMDGEQMEEFITVNGINCTVDASHPFAANVSINAIQASSNVGIPYVRFERESHAAEYSDVLMADSSEEAAVIAAGFDGNIFLTTGSNNLEDFVKNIADFRVRLFVRVLPMSSVIQKCEKLGLSADNIIAMKGPFSKELNKEMMRQCKAAIMVTKESGDAGGVSEKLLSARELGITTVMIKRPKIQYENLFNSIAGMIEYVYELSRVYIKIGGQL